MSGLSERMRNSSSFYIVLLYIFSVIILERSTGIVSASEYSQDKQAATSEIIQNHLDKINKPAIMTIESPDGDIIDCINTRKQLALDHPLMKNHKLQSVPPEMPKRENDVSDSRIEERVVIRQVWHQNRTSCPKGTVPIRRTTVDDVLRAGSLSGFGKKHPNIALARYSSSALTAQYKFQNHEHAILTWKSSNVVYGATAAINVWKPYVEMDSEFSLSQLWVTAGSYDAGDLNTVEAGWHVDPWIYRGDRSTRLFVYWTADAYNKTGCYNTKCAGFVQVDQRIVVGAAISEAEHEITLTVYQDPKTGNWWLNCGKVAVGYWPAELFTRLGEGATLVEWGGEVINDRPDGKHTTTQMGSGRFAQEGSGNASYFQRLGLVDSRNTILLPHSLSPYSTYSNCYSVIGPNATRGYTITKRASEDTLKMPLMKLISVGKYLPSLFTSVANSSVPLDFHPSNNIYFYYGGPGRNPQCP